MASVCLAIALVVLAGCATTTSRLDESQALRIGMNYATLKGWEVTNRVGSVTFRNWTGEWQMFFEIKDHPGLYTVFVNDKTKHVRHERGE